MCFEVFKFCNLEVPKDNSVKRKYYLLAVGKLSGGQEPSSPPFINPKQEAGVNREGRGDVPLWFPWHVTVSGPSLTSSKDEHMCYRAERPYCCNRAGLLGTRVPLQVARKVLKNSL